MVHGAKPLLAPAGCSATGCGAPALPALARMACELGTLCELFRFADASEVDLGNERFLVEFGGEAFLLPPANGARNGGDRELRGLRSAPLHPACARPIDVWSQGGHERLKTVQKARDPAGETLFLHSPAGPVSG